MADITEKLQDFFTNAHVNVDTLKNVLSEFLAVEIGGQKLYERALELVSDSEVRTKFREFHRQTVEHQKVLTDIIRKLGGDRTSAKHDRQSCCREGTRIVTHDESRWPFQGRK